MRFETHRFSQRFPPIACDHVAEIRNRFAGGESKNALSKQFGIHRKQVKRIVEHQSWK